MKRNFLFLISLLLIVSMLIFVSGCEKEINLTLKFVPNNGTQIDNMEIIVGQDFSLPDNLTKEGYTFKGWYIDNDTEKPFDDEFISKIEKEQEITLYGLWEVNKYTITFNSNGGSAVVPIIQDYNTTVTQPSAPTKAGYSFVGWFSDEELTQEYVFDKIPLEGITLYADWDINEYTITFNSNDGSAVAPITQNYNTTVEEPSQPTKVGYTFVSWCSDEELTQEYEINKMPAESITLYALWNINKYTIGFESNGGSIVLAITQDYGSNVTEPIAPTKTGYTFAGWFSDEELTQEYVFDKIPLEGITLYADWTINTYTLSFDSNGGSEVSQITEDYNTQVSAPEEPLKEGFYFSGWYDSQDFDNEFIFNTMPAESRTLFAYWSPLTLEYIKDNKMPLVDEIWESSSEDIGFNLENIIVRNRTYFYEDGFIPIRTVELDDIPIALEVYNQYEINIITDLIKKSAGISYTRIKNTNIILIDYISLHTIITDKIICEDGVYYNRDKTILIKNNSQAQTFHIPDTVKVIEDMAFAYNENIQTITASTNSQLEIIKERAFTECFFLQNITIPDTVEKIGDSAFFRCERLEYETYDGNLLYLSNWLMGIEGDDVLTAQLKDTTVGIYQDVFYGCSLQNIDIPDSVKCISEYAFDNCGNLTNVNIGQNSQLKYIGESAFVYAGLESIFLPKGVVEIGRTAFAYCSDLKEVSFDADIQLLQISEKAFYQCYALMTISIPASVKIIDDYAFAEIIYFGFEADSQLEYIGEGAFMRSVVYTITLPDSVRFLGEDAFSFSDNLEEFIIGQNSSLTYIGRNCFDGCNQLEYDTIDNVKYLGNWAIGVTDKSLTEYAIKDTAIGIASNAFASCYELTNITFPDTLKYINDDAFLNCTELVSIDTNNVESIGVGAFAQCESLTSVTFSNSLKTIEAQAFSTTSISSVGIPSSVEYISPMAFLMQEANFSQIIVSADNPNYSSCDGVLFNKDMTILLTYPDHKNDVSYTIPEGVALVFPLINNLYIEELVLPSTLKDMVFMNFYGLINLNTMIIPSTVVFIQEMSIQSCPNLTLYCEFAFQPDSWQEDWCDDSVTIVWGYNMPTVVYSFESNGGQPLDPITATVLNQAPIPVREGMYFHGWYLDEECSGDRIMFPFYSETDVTLYALWGEEKFRDGSALDTAYFLELGVVYEITEETVYFEFVPDQTCDYILSSSDGEAADPYVNIYEVLSNGNLDDFAYDDDGGEGYNFYIKTQLEAGKVYSIKVACNHSHPFSIMMVESLDQL